jgi:twitching motility two-component system response regulator PilH
MDVAMTSKKILVCDDSPTDLANIKNIVASTGYTVLTASNGKEALLKAKEERPNMIFMDIIMDQMDGYAATRELTNDPATKAIPVVFVSSKSQKADRIWAQMQGGKDLVSKPYTPDQILDQIRAYT